jgi:hypothetical protein
MLLKTIKKSMKLSLINLRLAIFLTILTFPAVAQNPVPNGINYQAIVRNNAGGVFVNQAVALRISILQGGAAGTVLYSERHQATTNAFGLVNLKIGGGVPQVGTFETVTWNTANHYVKIEVDPSGGANYQDIGTSELLSVPYAFYAENGAGGGGSYTAGTGISINGNVISNTGDPDPLNDIVFGSPAGGDLNGNYPDPAVKGIQGIPVSPVSPSNGQVLRYDGTSGTYIPSTIAAGGGTSVSEVYGTGNMPLSANGTFATIPGLSTTINVPAGAAVYISANGGLQTTSNSPTGYSTADVRIMVDNTYPGQGGAYRRALAQNTGGIITALESWTLGRVITGLSAGLHTIEIQARGDMGANCTVSGDNTSVSQGVLSIIILNP